jgi:hypothetical protein
MQPWLLIVILGIGVIGYACLRPKNEVAKQTAIIDDIEQALDQFAVEMDEDNKELMLSIFGLKRELEAEINKLNGRISVLEKQNSLLGSSTPISRDELSVEKTKPKPKRTIKKQEEWIDDHIDPKHHKSDELDDKPKDKDIKNRYGSLFELYTQGKSVEFIAKKTGMNKGEVQLIIQLARQEEQFRA